MPVNLDQIALDFAKMARVNEIVNRVDPIDDINTLYRILPPGYPPKDALERAKEMLRDWAKYATPEALKEIDKLVEESREQDRRMSERGNRVLREGSP